MNFKPGNPPTEDELLQFHLS